MRFGLEYKAKKISKVYFEIFLQLLFLENV